jgi:hypothetical protein
MLMPGVLPQALFEAEDASRRARLAHHVEVSADAPDGAPRARRHIWSRRHTGAGVPSPRSATSC